MIVIDFMAYARKVPTKKMALKTYEDFGVPGLMAWKSRLQCAIAILRHIKHI